MDKYIVITSIYPPTRGVKAFAQLADHRVIVVGDLKTPPDWQQESVCFLSTDKQKKMEGRLPGVLPYNHYSRKMLGYLLAVQNGAAIIIDTDDDNIPKESWSFPELEGTYQTIPAQAGFINIYRLFADQPVWPRGLPLSLVNKEDHLDKKAVTAFSKIGIWQGLADGDPDVDAIYRLTNNAACYFKDREPVVLNKTTLSPFNSQNTLFRKEVFPLLYLPAYVSFRFTDILRSLVAQPIMWLYGYRLGFTRATVVQERNPHDHFNDFLAEIPMYRHSERIADIVSRVISATDTLSGNLFNAYSALERQHIVPAEELKVLEAWLYDLDEMQPE